MDPWEEAKARQYLGMVVVLIVLVTNVLLGACGLLQTLQRTRRLVVVPWLRMMRNAWIMIMDECMEHERAMNVINFTKLFRIHGVCGCLVFVSRM